MMSSLSVEITGILKCHLHSSFTEVSVYLRFPGICRMGSKILGFWLVPVFSGMFLIFVVVVCFNIMNIVLKGTPKTCSN